MQPFLLSTDNTLVRIIVEPRYRWLRHLLLCVLLLILSYENVIFTFADDLNVLGWSVPLIIFIQFILFSSFYLNIYVLVPRFFLKGRYVTYSILLWALLTANFACSYWLEYFVIKIYSLNPSSSSFVGTNRWVFLDYISQISVTGMSCLGTTITILFRNWLTDGKRKADMESEHQRKTILNFKDTVNPSFLSEILATAARNTDTDAHLSADILARLSRYLRYRLYDSNRSVVFLNSETAFLDNYLSLVGHIRPGFSYTVTSDKRSGRALVQPSVLSGVTDSILSDIKPEAPLTMEVEIGTDEKRSVVLNFNVQSPAAPSTTEIESSLAAILDISYPSCYDMTVRGGGGRLYIRIVLNSTPSL